MKTKIDVIDSINGADEEKRISFFSDSFDVALMMESDFFRPLYRDGDVEIFYHNTRFIHDDV